MLRTYYLHSLIQQNIMDTEHLTDSTRHKVVKGLAMGNEIPDLKIANNVSGVKKHGEKEDLIKPKISLEGVDYDSFTNQEESADEKLQAEEEEPTDVVVGKEGPQRCSFFSNGLHCNTYKRLIPHGLVAYHDRLIRERSSKTWREIMASRDGIIMITAYVFIVLLVAAIIYLLCRG